MEGWGLASTQQAAGNNFEPELDPFLQKLVRLRPDIRTGRTSCPDCPDRSGQDARLVRISARNVTNFPCRLKTRIQLWYKTYVVT